MGRRFVIAVSPQFTKICLENSVDSGFFGLLQFHYDVVNSV